MPIEAHLHATPARWSRDIPFEPVIVLQAGIRNESSPLACTESEWEAFQRQAATIASNAVYGMVNDSDHAIPARNPDDVVAATTSVSQSIRDGNAPLGECPSGLAQAGVTVRCCW